MDRLADSVKEAARAGLLRQALDARERGNVAAAFHLLKEEYGNRPDELEVAIAFWDVACEYGRERDASAAVAGLIRRHAQMGQADLASQYWVELTARVEGALADPTALARIVPVLTQQVAQSEKEAAESDEDDDELRAMSKVRQAALIQAFRAAVSPENTGLTAGVALHLAEQARELDPASALAAARAALASSELHEAKRQRMLDLIGQLDAAPQPELETDGDLEIDPTLETDGDLDGESILETDGDLEPALEAEPEPVLEAEPEPVLEAEPEPVLEAEPEPVLEAEPEPVLEAEAETVLEAEPEPEPAGAVPAAAPEPAVEAEPDPARAHPLRTQSPPRSELSDDELEALRRRLPPSRSTPTPSAADTTAPTAARVDRRRLELHNGRLCRLGDATLVVELDSGRRARVAYDSLQAIAIGQIDGLSDGPAVVIDLLLNWRSGPSEGQPLRGVRLRLPDIDAQVALEEPANLVLTGRELLHELLDRAPAAPLPGPDAALGGPIPSFASPQDYAREVLGIRGH